MKGARASSTGRLHVAVLTYNALEYTVRCVRALYENTGEPFDLWIVDNQSTDGTRDWLNQLAIDGLHVHYAETNLGVPGGRNRLLEQILPVAADDDYVIFLDNDIEVERGWTAPFRVLFGACPEARIAGKMGHQVRVVGDRRVLMPEPASTAPVDAVSGGFACWVRVDAARAIGPFDEGLGLFWHEDDDYCVRARALGMGVFAVPESGMVHYGQKSGVGVGTESDRRSSDNQAYLVDKWRAAGCVDAGGWIHSPDVMACVPHDVRSTWAEAGANRGVEVAQAMWALRSLQNGWTESTLSVRPLHLRIAGFWRERGVAGADQLEAWLRDAITSVCPLVPEEAAGSGNACGVFPADADWDQPDFVRAGRDLQGDDGFEAQGEMRWSQDWQQIRAFQELDAAGVLHPRAAGLVRAGALQIQFELARRVGMVVSADRFEAEADLEKFADAPAVHAQRPYPEERLRLVSQDVRALDLGDARFDFAAGIGVLGNFRHEEDLERALRELARVVKPAGTVVVTGPLAIDAPWHPGSPSWRQLQVLLERAGLELAEGHAEPVVTSGALTGSLLQSFDGVHGLPACVVLRKVQVEAQSEVRLLPRQPAAVSSPGLDVALDVRTLEQRGSVERGIGHYTIYHLEALVRAAPAGARFHCFGESADPPEALTQLMADPRVGYRSMQDYRPGEFDLVHLPDPMNLTVGFDSPFRVFREARTSILFHDLIPLHHLIGRWPATTARAYRQRLDQVCDLAARPGVRILTNSGYTAQDLCQTMGVSTDVVTPVLAGRNTRGATTDVDVRAEFGLSGPYFLHVGALDGHKNFAAVLDAWRELDLGERAQLVLAGTGAFPGADLLRYVAREGISGVVVTGFVSREILEALYREAQALVFVSRMEGFGFPALEAMGQGCPVICSNTSSLPEVVGDAALTLDPSDREGLMECMTRLLAGASLRAELRTRGLARASDFSWDLVAHRTWSAWAELGVGAPGQTAPTPV